MKLLSYNILFMFPFWISLSQVDIFVGTDKNIYPFGDTLLITVIAYNPSVDTVDLNFPSSCQPNFYLDNFNFYANISCFMVPTSAKVPPQGTKSWTLKYPYHNSGFPHLEVGSHSVLGEVLGYGKSDTLSIIVSPITFVPSSSNDVEYFLGQNYPNPFNSETTIPFIISRESQVTITLYDIVGRHLRVMFSKYCSPGSYSVKVDFSDLPSGLYVYEVKAGEFKDSKKAILSK